MLLDPAAAARACGNWEMGPEWWLSEPRGRPWQKVDSEGLRTEFQRRPKGDPSKVPGRAEEVRSLLTPEPGSVVCIPPESGGSGLSTQ